jgi:hypothetical protein
MEVFFMKEEVIVSFYFTNGKLMQVAFSNEKLNDLIKNLRTSWNSCTMADNKFGINFTQVTHYEVEEIEE